MPTVVGPIRQLARIVGVNRSALYQVCRRCHVGRARQEQVLHLISELMAQGVQSPKQVLEYLYGTRDRAAMAAEAKYFLTWDEHFYKTTSRFQPKKMTWTWGRVIVVAAFYLEEVEREEHELGRTAAGVGDDGARAQESRD